MSDAQRLVAYRVEGAEIFTPPNGNEGMHDDFGLRMTWGTYWERQEDGSYILDIADEGVQGLMMAFIWDKEPSAIVGWNLGKALEGPDDGWTVSGVGALIKHEDRATAIAEALLYVFRDGP